MLSKFKRLPKADSILSTFCIMAAIFTFIVYSASIAFSAVSLYEIMGKKCNDESQSDWTIPEAVHSFDICIHFGLLICSYLLIKSICSSKRVLMIPWIIVSCLAISRKIVELAVDFANTDHMTDADAMSTFAVVGFHIGFLCIILIKFDRLTYNNYCNDDTTEEYVDPYKRDTASARAKVLEWKCGVNLQSRNEEQERKRLSYFAVARLADRSQCWSSERAHTFPPCYEGNSARLMSYNRQAYFVY